MVIYINFGVAAIIISLQGYNTLSRSMTIEDLAKHINLLYTCFSLNNMSSS